VCSTEVVVRLLVRRQPAADDWVGEAHATVTHPDCGNTSPVIVIPTAPASAAAGIGRRVQFIGKILQPAAPRSRLNHLHSFKKMGEACIRERDHAFGLPPIHAHGLSARATLHALGPDQNGARSTRAALGGRAGRTCDPPNTPFSKMRRETLAAV